MRIDELFAVIANKGIVLWINENNEIAVHDPQHVLSQNEKAGIIKHKERIAERLFKENYIAKSYPMSIGQEALWFIQKMAPESPPYNVCTLCVRIKGAFDIEAIKTAFQALVNRHECLRTVFGSEKCRGLFQNVYGYKRIHFDQIDATALDQDELTKEVKKVYEEPFDLENEIPIRVHLFQISDQDYVLLNVIHHIVIDRMSNPILLKDLKEFYMRVIKGESIAFAKPDSWYSDFVRWQSDFLKSPGAKMSLDYWKKKLKGDLPVLNLHFDYPRPEKLTFKGATVFFEFDKQLSKKIINLTKAEHTTLFRTLLTAYKILLYRYTGQKDIIVGAPAAGRAKDEFKRLIGHFINMLPLRTDVTGDLSFRQLLASIDKTVKEAIVYQTYPFSELVKSVSITHEQNISPVFQVIFTFQKFKDVHFLFTDKEHFSLGNLKTESFIVGQGEGQFDLSLEMLEAQESIIGHMRYNTDLFKEKTISRIVDQFTTLFESIVAEPDRSIAKLPILSSKEKHQLLYKTEELEKFHPESIAVAFEDKTINYKCLDEKTNQLAYFLNSKGVSSGSLVAILLDKPFDVMISILSILKAGGGYLLLSSNWSQERSNYVLNIKKPAVLITHSELMHCISNDKIITFRLDTDWNLIERDQIKDFEFEIAFENFIAAVNALGATGIPNSTIMSKKAIGSLTSGRKIFVLDQNLQLQPIGVPGELYIDDINPSCDYFINLNLTKHNLVQDPFNSNAKSYLLRTGDLAKWLPDGNIEFLGATDNYLTKRGFRICLQKIETALSNCSLVNDSSVAERDCQSGKMLVAYIVRKMPKNKSDEDELTEFKRYLKSTLADHMIPEHFIFMESLPLAPNGKVDTKALPEPELSLTHNKYEAPRNHIEKQLVSIWEEVLRLESIGINDNFFEIGGNSLVAVQIVTNANFEGIQIEPQDLFEYQTIAELASSAGPADSEPEFDAMRETALDSDISTYALSYVYQKELSSVLLTGATGFIGAFLLDELIARTNATIYCLVRRAVNNTAAERIKANLKAYCFGTNECDKRIIPVIGDLSKPLLGLSAEAYEQLAEQIDIIYHNGAWVNLIFPYPTLRPANVFGTAEVLRFASQFKIKPVHYISSVSVFRSPAYNHINYESDMADSSLIQGRSMCSQGYLRSKCVGEHLVMEAHKRGIPGSIYRIGNVTGHSVTGIGNDKDFHSSMIKGCIQLGKAPLWNERVLMTPADYISKAVVHLSKKKESAGKAFHLVTSDPLKWAELFDYIGTLFPMEIVSIEKWNEELKRVLKTNDNALSPFISSMLPSFLEEESGSLEFDCSNAITGLANSYITCPASDKMLLDLYFTDDALTTVSLRRSKVLPA